MCRQFFVSPKGFGGRFASRAKQIKNTPRVNEDPKDALLKEYQDEISRLKAQLEAELEAERLASEGLPIPDELQQRLRQSAIPDDDDGGEDGASSSSRRPREKVVLTRVVEKKITKGLSDEEIARLEQEAEAERLAAEQRTAEEREELMRQKQSLMEKGQQVDQVLQEKQAQLDQKRADRSALTRKLKEIEQQMLQGKRFISQVESAEQKALQQRAQLEQQRIERARMQQQLREREDAQLLLADAFDDLQRNITEKQDKLKKLQQKYQQVKVEIDEQLSSTMRERSLSPFFLFQLTLLSQVRSFSKRYVHFHERSSSRICCLTTLSPTKRSRRWNSVPSGTRTFNSGVCVASTVTR